MCSNLLQVAKCITFLNLSYNYFIQNLYIHLWTTYTLAFKTTSNNGKLITTKKLKATQHRFHTAAMLFSAYKK